VAYTDVVFDLDGVLFHGAAAVPGAMAAFNGLPAGVRATCFSNTTTRSNDELARHLAGLGFQVGPEQMVTSLDVTLESLARIRPAGPLLVIGSLTLRQSLARAGHRLTDGPEAEWVVMGLDRELTYHSLTVGLRALENGARLLLTNPNMKFPGDGGLLPGPGAIAAALAAMGHQPALVCGKPEPEAVRTALRLRGIEPGPRVLMVGDDLNTDIRGAIAVGMDSALVLTGVSTRADVDRLNIRPTHVLEDLSRLAEILD